jgi:hypothetical protein
MFFAVNRLSALIKQCFFALVPTYDPHKQQRQKWGVRLVLLVWLILIFQCVNQSLHTYTVLYIKKIFSSHIISWNNLNSRKKYRLESFESTLTLHIDRQAMISVAEYNSPSLLRAVFSHRHFRRRDETCRLENYGARNSWSHQSGIQQQHP